MNDLSFQITADQLILRPPTLDDVEALYPLMADERLTTFLTWDAHTEKETTQTVVQSLITAQSEAKGYHWVIVDNSRIVGMISLIDVRRQQRSWEINRAELAYWISPDFQKKGFATIAAKAIVEFGFEKLSLHKLIVAHAESNIASAKIAKKIGFTQYAVERDAFRKAGQWHTLIWYDMLQQELIKD